MRTVIRLGDLVSTTALPEQGQLAHVRNRKWAVVDVLPATLPKGVDDVTSPRQHLVRLNSVEDDAFNEELQVIWELEPGASAIEGGDELPGPDRGFDDPDRFDAFLHAVRWGAISQTYHTRTLQAPFRSGISIEDYQLDPLVRALNMPRVSLLIADDVGLGKTIEAGLVAQELILRHRARRIFVVCPAGLQVQWQEQMRDKFGLDFRIVDSELMRDLRRKRGIHVNPWGHYPRLIVSIDYLKRERPLALFNQATFREDGRILPRWGDLLVVDEAHNVAPSTTKHYVEDSLRTKAVRSLVPHFEHKMFLTATPHNGYQASFTALLELLDDQRFAREVMPSKEQLGRVMVRRMKSELKKRWDGSARFPERKIRPIEVDYSEQELDLHRLLQEYATSWHGASGETVSYASGFVFKTLKKRLFSSPAAFAVTLEKHVKSLQRVRDTNLDDTRDEIGPLRRMIEEAEEDRADDETYEEETLKVLDAATSVMSEMTERQKQTLEQLRRTAQAVKNVADSKAERLVAWLRGNLHDENGGWNDERVILFTEYRTTQNYLHEILAAEGVAGDGRLAVMYGGMDRDEREKVKNAFQTHPSISDVRILLATDTASEGIDLQRYCSKLIHMEIPWNPNVMEQRNGRVDRHGQKATEVSVFHFVPAGYDDEDPDGREPGDLAGDLEFLLRAAKKVETIREDLGKVGPVIAEQVEDAMLGNGRVRLDTAYAEGGERADAKLLKFERNLQEEIEDLRQQLDETKRALDLTPENVLDVVQIGLALAGQPRLEEVEHPGLWPHPDLTRCPVFRVPPLSGTWASLLAGIEHPHTHELRPVVFDQALAHGRDDIVLAHLNHPLVQRCLRLLRAQVWSSQDDRSLARVAARVVRDEVLETPAVVAFGRIVVIGGRGHRLHEEIIDAGGVINEGRFRRFGTRRELEETLRATTEERVPEPVREQLTRVWDSVADPLLTSLEVRRDERLQTMRARLQQRAEREAADIETVLHDLGTRIREELDQPAAQLDLFTADFGVAERERFERNRSALEERLTQIPSEIEHEKRTIRDRYVDPEPQLFPFAVSFLVPRRIAFAAGGK